MTDREIVNRLQRRISRAEERIDSLEARNDHLETLIKRHLDVDLDLEESVGDTRGAGNTPEHSHDNSEQDDSDEFRPNVDG